MGKGTRFLQARSPSPGRGPARLWLRAAFCPRARALTYTVTFTDTSFNTVNRWEYSTDGKTWKEGGPGGSFTLYDTAFGSDSAALYVRAVVAVANTHRLSWEILGLAAEDRGQGDPDSLQQWHGTEERRLLCGEYAGGLHADAGRQL